MSSPPAASPPGENCVQRLCSQQRIWSVFAKKRGLGRKAALLPILERVLGAEHPDILTDRANLTHWIRVAAGEANS